MWPLPKINNKSIHLIIHQDQLFCYYIHKAATLAQTDIVCEQFDIPLITEALIYTPMSLIQAIKSFITKHHLEHAYSYLVLTKPLIQEQLVTYTQAHAQLQDLISPSPELQYYYHYIGPLQEASLFYVCGIHHTLLFQLQAIHAHLKLHMQAVRPPLSVQYDIYTYLYPLQTSLATVAQAIEFETISFTKLFESRSLHNSMSYNDTTYNKNLVYALGSFIGSKI